MKPLAIIGLGETHDDAPWQDETWERWGLSRDPYAPRCHSLFETHPYSRWKEDAMHIRRMADLALPIYMQETKPFILPHSIEYPMDEVVEHLRYDSFGSSIAYMLALAITQYRWRIGLWGVDLSDDAYDHQRGNLAWLCGVAMGRTITLEGPCVDGILGYRPSEKVRARYPKRYGYGEAA